MAKNDITKKKLKLARTTNPDGVTKVDGQLVIDKTNHKIFVDCAGDVRIELYDGKVDAVAGKGLSTEDFTTALKAKLEAIAEGAQVNVLEKIKVGDTEITITDKTATLGSLAGKSTIADTEINDGAISQIKISGLIDALSGKAAASNVTAIESKIPAEATAENKLADKAFVASAIESQAADYLTKTAAGASFDTKADLLAATEFYSGGVKVTPTKNDYAIVAKDEDHSNKQARYIVTVAPVGEGKPTFAFQYVIDVNFTDEERAALDSGITGNHVTKLNNIAEGATKVEASSTNGNIKINGAETGVYTLPVGAAAALGGVMGAAKEANDTQEVHIDTDGKMYTKPGEVLDSADNSLSVDHGTHKIGAKLSSAANNALKVETTSGQEGLYVEELCWEDYD